jgi:hypothetical protein
MPGEVKWVHSVRLCQVRGMHLLNIWLIDLKLWLNYRRNSLPWGRDATKKLWNDSTCANLSRQPKPKQCYKCCSILRMSESFFFNLILTCYTIRSFSDGARSNFIWSQLDSQKQSKRS